jgi:hypothetical protein
MLVPMLPTRARDWRAHETANVAEEFPSMLEISRPNGTETTARARPLRGRRPQNRIAGGEDPWARRLPRSPLGIRTEEDALTTVSSKRDAMPDEIC